MNQTFTGSKRSLPPTRSESVHSEDVPHGRSHSDDAERPRKRVRKGTKSCWECKRRKVKCQLSTEDVPVCSGCLSRGTSCLSQEFPEERDASSGLQVGERLGRVERLLETLLAKISAHEEEEEANKILTPESLGHDILRETRTVEVHATTDSSPYLQLFDNNMIGHVTPAATPATTPGVRTPYTTTKTACGRPSKVERIRQTLLELLPSEADRAILFNTNYSALLLNSAMWSTMPSEDGATTTITAPFMDIQKPVSIARTLLYVAVCMQQLEPSFDTSQLNIQPSIKIHTERILATVNALVTSDDELVTTMDGIECLIVQGMYSMNEGSPRRAWLTFRRALNIGQIMGLEKTHGNVVNKGRQIWHQMVKGDRYLSLLLGLSAGSNYDHYEPHETFQNPNVDKEDLFGRKLSGISLRIIQRGETGAHIAYTGTQEIDDSLDSLAKEMPSQWWEIPAHLSSDMSKETTAEFDRLMAQMWFFQIQALVHLPFMLRAATERRFEYNRFSCLKACRETIWRYLAMRKSHNRTFCCKVVDFGALTATVALFLGLLNPSDGSADSVHRNDADKALVHLVLDTMEQFSQNPNEVVAAQSVSVIKSLLAVEQPQSQNGGNLQLKIPYFGTVSIVRPFVPAVQGQMQTPPAQPVDVAAPVEGQLPRYQQQPANPRFGSTMNVESQPWNSLPMSMQNTFNKQPTVSFLSHHDPFAPPPPDFTQVGWNDADTLFFDSLLNADIEGNWGL